MKGQAQAQVLELQPQVRVAEVILEELVAVRQVEVAQPELMALVVPAVVVVVAQEARPNLRVEHAEVAQELVPVESAVPGLLVPRVRLVEQQEQELVLVPLV